MTVRAREDRARRTLEAVNAGARAAPAGENPMTTTTTTTPRPAKAASGTGFSDAEKEAMRERAREQRSAKGAPTPEEGEADVLARIAAMPEPDRALAARVHALVKAAAPDLVARTWYGMPAYTRDGRIVCFFKDAAKFKSRYATLGFEEHARLDDGEMWPVAFALVELTPGVEARITDLVRRAAG